MGVSFYTVIKPESFVQKSDRLSQGHPNLTVFNKFVYWHVQRDPKYFFHEIGNVYSISSSDLNTPDLLLAAKKVTHFDNLKVMYHVDDENAIVTLVCIDLEE